MDKITRGASLVARSVKNPLAMLEMQVRSLGQEDALEKEMATHSSISCLGNPMDREAWWATVHGVTRVRHNLVTKPSPWEVKILGVSLKQSLPFLSVTS